MNKLKYLFVAFALIAFVACNSGDDAGGDDTKTEQEQPANGDGHGHGDDGHNHEDHGGGDADGGDELAEHSCNDKCVKHGECHLMCGEKGHECSDACKKDDADTEGEEG